MAMTSDAERGLQHVGRHATGRPPRRRTTRPSRRGASGITRRRLAMRLRSSVRPGGERAGEREHQARRRARSRGGTGRSCRRSARTARRRRCRRAPPRCRWRSSPRTARAARSTRGRQRLPCRSSYARIMPKLAANLSMLFAEVAVPRALRRRGARGLPRRRVPVSRTSGRPRDIARRGARRAASRWCCTTCRRAIAQRGERGTACLPGREQRFRDDLERAIEYARAARCPQPAPAWRASCPPARSAPRCTPPTSPTCATRAQRLAREGMRLLIEPLSERTVANCFLRSSAQAAQVLDEVGGRQRVPPVRPLPHADHGRQPRR